MQFIPYSQLCLVGIPKPWLGFRELMNDGVFFLRGIVYLDTDKLYIHSYLLTPKYFPSFRMTQKYDLTVLSSVNWEIWHLTNWIIILDSLFVHLGFGWLEEKKCAIENSFLTITQCLVFVALLNAPTLHFGQLSNGTITGNWCLIPHHLLSRH